MLLTPASQKVGAHDSAAASYSCCLLGVSVPCVTQPTVGLKAQQCRQLAAHMSITIADNAAAAAAACPCAEMWSRLLSAGLSASTPAVYVLEGFIGGQASINGYLQ